MSEMIERIARVLFANLAGDPDWDDAYETREQAAACGDDDISREECFDLARAAIAAVLSCLPAHKASLTISHNLHKTYYEQIAKYLENGELTISDAEKAKAIETDELWEMQWFPDTPVGSCRVGAASFGALIEAALK